LIVPGGGTNFELWLAVIASGLYHGINPGMGWPLAVAAGLMERRAAALFSALGPLAIGHLAAMAVVLLPFAVLTMLARLNREIQIAAGLLVIAFGIFRLINHRHPRALARIRPTQLALWSFAIAIAHGAGLMLVPIYLGICTTTRARGMGHEAAGTLLAHNLSLAIVVSTIHAIAMVAAGGIVAWIVYRYAGLQVLSKAWINFDAVWAASLVLVGVAALLSSY
jgi:hypothetical protein